jgi:hypothetical protein
MDRDVKQSFEGTLQGFSTRKSNGSMHLCVRWFFDVSLRYITIALTVFRYSPPFHLFSITVPTTVIWWSWFRIWLVV